MCPWPDQTKFNATKPAPSLLIGSLNYKRKLDKEITIKMGELFLAFVSFHASYFM